MKQVFFPFFFWGERECLTRSNHAKTTMFTIFKKKKVSMITTHMQNALYNVESEN